jgi:uncharacterized membrane protein YidH (DUF202 family)
MKATQILGMALIVIGILALAYGGFSYTKREKVLDVGPIEATAERHKSVPIPPVLGGAAVIGGIALIVVGTRRRV